MAAMAASRNVRFHTENIENMVPRPPEVLPPKPPRFKSKFHAAVREEWENGRTQHLSMGEAETLLDPPEKFLRKHTGGGGGAAPTRAKSARTYREVHGPECSGTNRQPPVPSLTTHVIKAPRCSRNFVHWNALNQMRNAPGPAPEERMVDQANGNSQPVEKAGLAPKFTFKKDFGRSPAYLLRMRAEAAEEARRWQEEQEEEQSRKESMKLGEEEREAILQGLRSNWALVNQTYQGLSLLTDTLYKRQRRAKVESQLSQLEKFIEMLEKHTTIFITDNPYQLF